MLHFGMNMPYYLMMLYGSVMIVMVLILRALFRDRLPKFVFPVLWGVVLLRFLIPFSISSPLSIPMPWNDVRPVAVTYLSSGDWMSASVDGGPVFEFTADDSQHAQTVGYGDVSISYDPVTENISVKTGDSYGQAGVGSFLSSLFDEYAYVGTGFYNYYGMLRILLVLYIFGAVVVAGILGWQKFRCLKRLRNGLLVEHNETINTILRDMDMGHVLVFTNDEIVSPMVCGLFNPRIYLPTKMDFGDTMLLRHVLAHETMHIKRKDNWIKCAMLVVLCLNWFNPLVWVMARFLASDLESACDAAVLGRCGEEEKKDYAFSLLATAVSGSRMSLLYSVFSKTEVEKRMKNILSYKKATALVLLFTVLLMAGSMTAFASIGQAPFWSILTAFCSSDNSRWGIDVTITRDIALGENAQERAEDIVFSVLDTDETGDPEVIKGRILTELAREFGVERGAFHVETSFVISDERLREEYEPWGLSAGPEDTFWEYKDETIRTYWDKMLGSYQSNADGTVDVSIQRDRLGEITSIEVWHEGDPEYDKRTRENERAKYYWNESASESTTTIIQEHN